MHKNESGGQGGVCTCVCPCGVENTFGFILRWPGGFDQNKTGGDSVKPGGVSGSEYSGETKSVKRIQRKQNAVKSVSENPA